MARLTPQFSTNRMMKEYLERYYLPAATLYRDRLTGDHLQGFGQWRATVERYWDDLSFGEMSMVTETTPDGPLHTAVVEVVLGQMPPDSVRVELYAEPLTDSPAERHALTPVARTPGGGRTARVVKRYQAVLPAHRPAHDYTPRIVPWREGALVPLETNRILWYR